MKKKYEIANASATPATGGIRVQPFLWGLLGGLGVLVALLIGMIVGQLATVLVYIGIALFLALGLDPLVTLLEKKMPRGAAIAVIVVAVLAVVTGILMTVVPVAVEQISNLVKYLPGWLSDIQHADWYLALQKQFGANFNDLYKQATDYLTKNVQSLSGGVLAVGGGILNAFTGAVVVLILTLYFMASLRSMKQLAARFVPAYRREGFSEVLDDVTGAVGRYVMGQVSLAAINGVLTLILMLILQAPLPVLLAVIAFIGSLIPMVGTLISSVINSLICLVVSPIAALVAGIWYLVYMQVEAYILSPRIMNKAVAVPGALVVIGAVGGAAVGQVLGALVAVPVIASIIIIVQKVAFPRLDRITKDPAKTPVTVTETQA